MIQTAQVHSATIAQEVIPRDDKEGDGEGLGREHVQQRLDAVGQLRHGGGQSLPGGGVVNKWSAGLGAVDPETPRGETDMSNASTERGGRRKRQTQRLCSETNLLHQLHRKRSRCHKKTLTQRDSLCYANNDGQTCQHQANQQDAQEEEVGAGGSERTCGRAAVMDQRNLGSTSRTSESLFFYLKQEESETFFTFLMQKIKKYLMVQIAGSSGLQKVPIQQMVWPYTISSTFWGMANSCWPHHLARPQSQCLTISLQRRRWNHLQSSALTEGNVDIQPSVCCILRPATVDVLL